MTVPAWSLCDLPHDAWVGLPLGLRLRLAAGLHLGWHYTPKGVKPAVPFAAGSIPADLVKPDARVTACSTFALALLMAAYPDAPWTMKEYGELQSFAELLPARPFACLDAVERMGVGERVTTPVPQAWHFVQGWVSLKPPFPGHAFLAWPDGSVALILQAASTGGIGPCWTVAPLSTLLPQSAKYPAGVGWARLFDLDEYRGVT